MTQKKYRNLSFFGEVIEDMQIVPRHTTWTFPIPIFPEKLYSTNRYKLFGDTKFNANLPLVLKKTVGMYNFCMISRI